MRIWGKDFALQPLTVGALRAFLDKEATKRPNFDEWPVHFLCMEGSEEDGDETRYVTHVDIDAIDNTSADPNEEGARGIWCVSLMHWPNRDKK